MPTVRNDGTTVKSWNNMLFKPGEIKKIDFFVPPEEWLAVLSEEPRVPPKCLAADRISVRGNESVEIPIPICEVFRASFICLSGVVDIRQNYADAQPVSITPEITYEIKYRRADVEKIILTGIDDAYVVYDIEEVM
jgi:hypothetical protein